MQKFLFFLLAFHLSIFTLNAQIGKLKFLSEYEVPLNKQFKSTTIGGLSGIDYDSKSSLYYIISDDRSAINPARFYTAKIIIKKNKIDTVIFVDVKNMLQKNGEVYPNSKQDPQHTPDPEDIRFNQQNNLLYWTSEGERIVNANDTVLENAAITIMTKNGEYIDTLPLPANLKMHAIEKGPRRNSVLEGLSFTKDFKTLYVDLEEPLYEDAERADLTDNNPFTRLYKFNVASKKNIAQYAYTLSPVAHAAITPNAYKINGIPAILSIGENKLLVVERSFSTGVAQCTIRVFLTDLSKATNIINNTSLKENKNFVPATKKLLLNMDDLGFYIDNIEGITFGPTLPNGHKTLVFVSDNNFNPLQKTQFLLFEILP